MTRPPCKEGRAHHWRLADQGSNPGPVVEGVCTICGASSEFSGVEQEKDFGAKHRRKGGQANAKRARRSTA